MEELYNVHLHIAVGNPDIAVLAKYSSAPLTVLQYQFLFWSIRPRQTQRLIREIIVFSFAL